MPLPPPPLLPLRPPPVSMPRSNPCAGCQFQQVGNTVRNDGYVPAICAFARPLETDLQHAWDAASACKCLGCALGCRGIGVACCLG